MYINVVDVNNTPAAVLIRRTISLAGSCDKNLLDCFSPCDSGDPFVFLEAATRRDCSGRTIENNIRGKLADCVSDVSDRSCNPTQTSISSNAQLLAL